MWVFKLYETRSIDLSLHRDGHLVGWYTLRLVIIVSVIQRAEPAGSTHVYEMKLFLPLDFTFEALQEWSYFNPQPKVRFFRYFLRWRGRRKWSVAPVLPD
jgi:hypothetical protein